MALADLVGTTIVVGILILMMIALTGSVSESTTQQMLDVTTQEALTTVKDMIEYDFHKMGFESIPGTAITTMGAHNITFWAGIDTNNDGSPDGLNTITYQLSGTSQAASTPNPNDCILYRTIGVASPVAVSLGVTGFDLQYYNKYGNVTVNPPDVKSVRVGLTVQSTMPYDNRYSEAAWEKMISPKNL